jgi:HD-GYP domain-containing protein (c-di-GMP phosphodiesterase class II)
MAYLNNKPLHTMVIHNNKNSAANISGFISPDPSIITSDISNIHDIDMNNFALFIICIDDYSDENSDILDEFISRASGFGISTLFVIEESFRTHIAKIFSIGGTACIMCPLSQQKMNLIISEYTNKFIENSWDKLSRLQSSALKASLDSFKNMMTNAGQSEPLHFGDIQASARQAVQAIQSEGLQAWNFALKEHHNHIFSHSLQTCGYLVEFSHEIGISGEEIENLAIAGIVHDIGKVHIPQWILNKPGQLSPDEFNVIKHHPAVGYEILQQNSEIPAVVLDATLHHHERLDGSGYPDGLKGSQISNVALLVAIADVFSALTEKRPYKEELSNEEAYDLMLGMDKHLDMSLVQDFEPIAFKQRKLSA